MSDVKSALFKAGGAGSLNCEGRVRAHGLMVAYGGPLRKAFRSGVGRHTPTTFAPKNGGGGGAFPSVSRKFQIASATVWPHAAPLLIAKALSLKAPNEALRCAVRLTLCAGYTCSRMAKAA